MTKSPEISFTKADEHFKSLVWAANKNLSLSLPDNNNNPNINYDFNMNNKLDLFCSALSTPLSSSASSQDIYWNTFGDPQREMSVHLSEGKIENEREALKLSLNLANGTRFSIGCLNFDQNQGEKSQQLALTTSQQSISSLSLSSISSKVSHSTSSLIEHSGLINERVRRREQKRVEPMIVISTPSIEWARATGCPLPIRVCHYSTPLSTNLCNNRGSMTRLRQLQISLLFCLLVVSVGPTLKAAFGAPAPTNTMEQNNPVNQLKLKRSDTSHWIEQTGDNSQQQQQQQQQNNNISPSITVNANLNVNANKQQQPPNDVPTTTTNLKRTEVDLGIKTTAPFSSSAGESASNKLQSRDEIDNEIEWAGRDGTVRSSRIKRTGTSDQRLADYEVQLMRRDKERARAAAAAAAAATTSVT